MKEEKVIVERRSGTWRKYIGYGLTAFFVIAAAILLIFAFVNHEQFSAILAKINTALAPVIAGAVLAYIMNPLMMFFENGILKSVFKHPKKITRAKKAARVISIILTMIVVLLIIGFLFYLLIPELRDTIGGMIDEAPERTEQFLAWYDSLDISNSSIGGVVDKAVEKGTAYIEKFTSDEEALVDLAKGLLGSMYTGLISFFSAIYNVIIGLIFSVYMLFYKEKLCAQAVKIIYAIFKRKASNNIVRVARQCHKKFTGAISGKIVDSCIIGLLCFIGMTVFDFPYAVLISVLVGVTNVIPFFGPYFGAIPSAILIVFVNPMQCLYFIIMIIVIQQLDCNVITPKIVGDSIGLSPFWVMLSIIVFGSLMGVVGMMIGAPLMACIYMIIKEIVESRLHKKGLKVETAEYMMIEPVDETELVCIEYDDKSEKTAAEQPAAADSDKNDKADM